METQTPMSPDGRALKKEWSMTIMRDMQAIQGELKKKTLRKDQLKAAIAENGVLEESPVTGNTDKPTPVAAEPAPAKAKEPAAAPARGRKDVGKENAPTRNPAKSTRPAATKPAPRAAAKPAAAKPAAKPVAKAAARPAAKPRTAPAAKPAAKPAAGRRTSETKAPARSAPGARRSSAPTSAAGRRTSAPTAPVAKEPPRSMLPMPSNKLKVRGITVFKGSTEPENVLGEVIVSKETTMEELRRLMVEELGLDFAFQLKKGFIPVNEKQMKHLVVDFFRSEEDHAVVVPLEE